MYQPLTRVMLTGCLTTDPVMGRKRDGKTMAKFTLATSDMERDEKSGEERESVKFHNIVVFNQRFAKIAQEHLRNGAYVHVEGTL